MELQDLSATLQGQVARDLFSTSSQVLIVNPQDSEKDDTSDDDEGLRSEDNDCDSEGDADESENEEEEEDITPDGRNTGHSNH